MKYKEKTGQPLSIAQTKRTIVIIDSATYLQLNQNPVYRGKLLSPGNSKYFLINEHTTTFYYKKIEADNLVQLPVKVSDRIVLGSNGNYVPVSAFSTYLLTNEN